MHIGVLTVRDEGYHPNGRLKAAAEAKGLSLALIDPRKILPGIANGKLHIDGLNQAPLPGVILPRQGSQISDASIVALAHLEALGIPTVNRLESVLTARNKFATLRVLAANGIHVPHSVFIGSEEALCGAVEVLGGYPLVCKKPVGRKGREVFLVEDPHSAQHIVNTHFNKGEGMILQQFIPPGKGRRDYRVMVIGGKVAAAMEMTVPEGDFRSNFGLSGNSRPVSLSAAAKETAMQCARATGLAIAGIDLIDAGDKGLYTIEANYAPGFRGLEMVTGIDIAAMIIDLAATFLQ